MAILRRASFRFLLATILIVIGEQALGQPNMKDKQQDFQPEICDLPPETGRCYAYLRNYYFDKATGQCKEFVYGGCGGNENNFDTLEQCEQIKMRCLELTSQNMKMND